MKTKSILTLSIFLLLVVIFSMNVSAYECNPSGCPSGYQDKGIKCDISGLNYECKRECYKPGSCGSYSIAFPEKTKNVYSWQGKYNRGDTYNTPFYYVSSNYCYKFFSQTTFSVSKWGGADSMKIYTGNANLWSSKTTCTTSPNPSVTSSTYTLGRGSSGNSYSASGSVRDYENKVCGGGNPLLGDLEGGLSVYLWVSKAPWVEDTIYKTCSGTWDCESGDTKCEGNDYYSCRNHEWLNEGKVVGECEVECKSNYDCSSGEICKDYKCIPDPCKYVTCEDKCQNSIRYYNGYCKDGECKYDTTTCTHGCLGKFCAQDLCVGVVCDDKCENSIWKHDGTPIVVGSRCECEYTEDTCQYGCKNEPPKLLAIVVGQGMCRTTPCEGIVCDDYCSETSLFYDGKCISGECTQFKEKLYAEECGFVSPWKKWYVWVGGVIFISLIIFGIRYWRRKK